MLVAFDNIESHNDKCKCGNCDGKNQSFGVGLFFKNEISILIKKGLTLDAARLKAVPALYCFDKTVEKARKKAFELATIAGYKPVAV